jgi:beta-galactosidase
VYVSTWRGSNGIASWSWSGCEGKKAIVDVFVPDGEKVRLEINGKPVGTKKVTLHKAQFKTRYVPGMIEAVSLDANGNEISRSVLSSAKENHRIALQPENGAMPGRIVYVPVSVCDENGVVECNADEKITVQVEGGELLAFGSANPCTTESYLSGSYTTYYGRALAVIRCKEKTVTVTAKGERLPKVRVTF